MNIRKRIYLIAALSIFFILGACKKQNEWLEKKSNKANVVPETIKDYQAILDDPSKTGNYINTGLLGSDNITMTNADVSGLYETSRNMYLWNKTIWVDGISAEWKVCYTAIAMANIVFEGMTKIDHSEKGYNNVLGQAYFYRSIFYYNLAQTFCKPYTIESSANDLGVPIRLTPDVSILNQRSTLQQLYDQIIEDALNAEKLLDENQVYNVRPSRFAAKALLAKIYLSQQNYTKAKEVADEILLVKKDLLDYNNSSQVSLGNAYRFLPNGVNNPEILYFAKANIDAVLQNYVGSVCYVSPELYQQYNTNDLRRTMLYGQGTNGINFAGSYTGTFDNFSGLAINEVYLIRAESLARSGDRDGALKDVNRLLSYRYKTGTFTNLVANSDEEALRVVLNERRKELPLVSQIRWEDLRRLNKDDRFQVTIKRNVNGTIYTLPPNDPRYVLPIPDQEIQFSGLEQNKR